ncbi:MAG: OmpA family protein [Betaproteobacteria bacterium]|jgi:outer membrane protein OmpA-like peptidoglycan-associated protein
MRGVLASVIVAVTMTGCAAPHSDAGYPRVRWSNSSQPIEPGALRPSERPARDDLIVLLPKPNGKIGGVVVRTAGGKEIVLDKAYAGAHIEGPGEMQSVRYDADRVKREFSPVLAALPGRPATFLLYFLEGNDEITPESEREVERIFAEIAARPYPEILVIGHTDAVGNAQFNDQLSRQRAQRVYDELIKRGIAPDRIEVSGRGKREPLIPTPEGVSEPKNRRVEINVR